MTRDGLDMTPWSPSSFSWMMVMLDVDKENMGPLTIREIEILNVLKSNDWQMGRKRWHTEERLLQ